MCNMNWLESECLKQETHFLSNGMFTGLFERTMAYKYDGMKRVCVLGNIQLQMKSIAK